MLQRILDIDNQLFNFITQKMQCPFLDTWMPVITDFDNWIWLIVLGWIGLFIFGGRKGRWACVVVLVTVLIADNFNSYILKPFFGRLRPNVTGSALSAYIAAGGHIPSPSFPSGHATNIFALAMVLSWYYPKISPVWFFIAIAVGFSRVYIGVHYPLDVISGAIAGILWALCIIWCAKRIELWFHRKFKKGKRHA